MHIKMKLKLFFSAFVFSCLITTCMTKRRGKSRKDCREYNTCTLVASLIDFRNIIKNSAKESCGIENMPIKAAAAMIGGVDVTPVYRYPWMVLIDRTVGNVRIYCGGFLISREFVLTAAHCFPGSFKCDDYYYHPLCAELEILFLTRYHQASKVKTLKEVIVHPRYDSKKHDIALVRLSEPATCGIFSRPICLWTKSGPWDIYGRNATVSGWGYSVYTNEEKENVNDTLKEAVAKIFPKEECRRDRIICTAGFGQGPCDGDSGGPLFIQEDDGRYYAVGVIITVVTTCDPRWNSTRYTEIRRYMNWIRKYVDLN